MIFTLTHSHIYLLDQSKWVVIAFLYSSCLSWLCTLRKKRSLNINYPFVWKTAFMGKKKNLFSGSPLCLKQPTKMYFLFLLNLTFESWLIDFFKGSKRSSLSTAGRSQRSVGAQGSTAWVWGEQRSRPQRHEPHQGWPGYLHRQLTPL